MKDTEVEVTTVRHNIKGNKASIDAIMTRLGRVVHRSELTQIPGRKDKFILTMQFNGDNVAAKIGEAANITFRVRLPHPVLNVEYPLRLGRVLFYFQTIICRVVCRTFRVPARRR
jgi:hypothetical protein